MQSVHNNETSQAKSTNQQIIEAGKTDPQNAIPAHEAAEADMLQDAELNGIVGQDDGLDEGELARLEGEN